MKKWLTDKAKSVCFSVGFYAGATFWAWRHPLVAIAIIIKERQILDEVRKAMDEVMENPEKKGVSIERG